MGSDKYHWMCPEPFTNIYASSQGWWKPCCVITSKELYKYRDDMRNVTDTTHKEYWNNNIMKRMRKAMKDGGDDEFLFSICAACKNKEDIGINSIRQWYLERFYNDVGEFKDYKDEFEKIIDTECEPTFYHSMEFLADGGHICNLSCNMCNEGSSSTYHNEALKLGDYNQLKKYKSRIIKELPDVANMNLLELKFTGGEPLMMQSMWDFIEKTNAKVCRIITNMSVSILPKRWELFKKFDKVIINVSIEGPEHINNYIRYPSKWDIIQKNINIMNSMENFYIYYVSTINALNISHLPQIDDTPVKQSVCESLVTNNFYNITSIPPDVKDIYLDRLWSKKSLNKQDLVEKLTVLLETQEHNEIEMWKMLGHIKRRDIHRGTNLLDILPEWKKYYENCDY